MEAEPPTNPDLAAAKIKLKGGGSGDLLVPPKKANKKAIQASLPKLNASVCFVSS